MAEQTSLKRPRSASSAEDTQKSARSSSIETERGSSSYSTHGTQTTSIKSEDGNKKQKIIHLVDEDDEMIDAAPVSSDKPDPIKSDNFLLGLNFGISLGMNMGADMAIIFGRDTLAAWMTNEERGLIIHPTKFNQEQSLIIHPNKSNTIPRLIHAAGLDKNKSPVQRVIEAMPNTHYRGRMTLFRLPMELQTQIYLEALGERGIHFIQFRKTQPKDTQQLMGQAEPNHWGMKAWRQPKDTSSHNVNRNFERICNASIQATLIQKRHWESTQILPQGLNPRAGVYSMPIEVDSNDIVCMELGKDFGDVEIRYFSPELSWVYAPLINQPYVTNHFSNYRHVAVAYRHKAESSMHRNCPMFRCFMRTLGTQAYPFDHKKHKDWKMCPTELAGFINKCHMDIRQVWIVFFPPGKNTNAYKEIRKYYDKFMANIAECRERGYDYVEDAKNAYVELCQELVDKWEVPTVPEYEHLFALVEETKQALLLEGESTISRELITWRLTRAVRERVYIGILIPFSRDNKPRV